MKRIYLVKKDPGLPAGRDNWTVMNGREFRLFLQTEEGRKREKGFGRLNGCGAGDVIIFAECGEELAEEWNREAARDRYLRSLRDGAGPGVFSYHQIRLWSDEEVFGEELLEDEGEGVEEKAFGAVMRGELREALGTLTAGERDLVEKLFLSDRPMTDGEYAESAGLTAAQVRYWKQTVLDRLRMILDGHWLGDGADE